MVDLDRATRLEPDDGQASYLRGSALFYLGRFPKGARDYERSLHIFPENRFGHLLLSLAREWSWQDGGQDLARHTAELDLRGWPEPVMSLFLGHAMPEQVLAAVQHVDPRPPREPDREAFFYPRRYYRRRGDRDQAARLFRQTLDTGITCAVSRASARVIADRMVAPTSTG